MESIAKCDESRCALIFALCLTSAAPARAGRIWSPGHRRNRAESEKQNLLVNIRSMPSSSKKNKPLVRVISSKTAFRGPVFSVMTDEVEEPAHVRARRGVILYSGSIV